MRGRVWTWLLGLEPVQEAVRRDVKAAVELVMDDTERAQNRQRERHRAAQSRIEQDLAELRATVEELTGEKADLVAGNAALRVSVTEYEEASLREVAEREEFARRLLRDQETAAARQWHDATSDVFCCQSCWAFWFLSTAPDRASCIVRGPYGRHDDACSVCADPLVALPAAKSVVYRRGAEDRVSRPTHDDEAIRSDVVVANAELVAIADGLARLPKVPSRTASWIAADLTGSPDLPAKVLDEIATRTTMAVPLDGIVAGIRAFTDVQGPSVTLPEKRETSPSTSAP